MPLSKGVAAAVIALAVLASPAPALADERDIFDILATNEDGDAWLLPDVDLCETTTVTITAKFIKAQ